MLVFRISNFLTGTIKLRVIGDRKERFINLCMAHDIYVWQITDQKDYIEVCLRLPDFFRIRKLVKISRCRVKVIGWSGLPFFLKKIRMRKMFVFGAVLFIILLQGLASYIWFIDVIGTKQLSAEQITTNADRHGLKVGKLKKDINIKNLETEMMFDLPQIAWIGINFKGTRAVIEVVEKTFPKQEDRNPGNLLSSKDGVITEIIVLSGEPLVKIGDTVKKRRCIDQRGTSASGYCQTS